MSESKFITKDMVVNKVLRLFPEDQTKYVDMIMQNHGVPCHGCEVNTAIGEGDRLTIKQASLKYNEDPKKADELADELNDMFVLLDMHSDESILKSLPELFDVEADIDLSGADLSMILEASENGEEPQEE